MTRHRVSSLALIQEAALEIYSKRAVLSVAVILPILCSLALRMAYSAYVCTTDDVSRLVAARLIFSFAPLPFYVMFATICHRAVLLGDDSLPKRWGLFWSVRETRFLGWIFVLGVVTLVVSLPIYFLIPQLPNWALDWLAESPISISFYTCILASTYIDGRLGMVLPATAIGNSMRPLRSWRSTAGNGWSIFVALMIPILTTELIDYLLFDLLLDIESVIVNTLTGLIYYPLIAIGVVVITIAYRDLVLLPNEEVTT